MVIKQQSVLIVSYCYSGLKASVDFTEAFKNGFSATENRVLFALNPCYCPFIWIWRNISIFLRYYLWSDNIITPDIIFFCMAPICYWLPKSTDAKTWFDNMMILSTSKDLIFFHFCFYREIVWHSGLKVRPIVQCDSEFDLMSQGDVFGLW